MEELGLLGRERGIELTLSTQKIQQADSYFQRKQNCRGKKHTFDVQHVNGVWVAIVLDLNLIKIN